MNGSNDPPPRTVAAPLLGHPLAALPQGYQLLFNLWNVLDLLWNVLEDLGHGDAASFMLVYIGSCPRNRDRLIVDQIACRFPRLHILSVSDPKRASELFPHHTKQGGGGVIYKDKMMHIPIAFVTSQRRERVRSEASARSGAKSQAAEAPSNQLPELDAKDVGDHTKDCGYRENEAVLVQYASHLTHPDAKRQPAVNGGWSVRKYRLDPDNQYSPADPLDFFESPPDLTVRVVDAETGLPVFADQLHGGLKACSDLLKVDYKMKLCAPKKSTGGISWCPPKRYKPEPNGPLTEFPKGGMQAVVARFKPMLLSGEHLGRKFCIVVECTGKRRSSSGHASTDELKMTARTAPLTFQHDKTKVTRRRASS
jgi:hypothetical protein